MYAGCWLLPLWCEWLAYAALSLENLQCAIRIIARPCHALLVVAAHVTVSRYPTRACRPDGINSQRLEGAAMLQLSCCLPLLPIIQGRYWA
jgi:hypothetical protein